jgi:hypothetical protein
MSSTASKQNVFRFRFTHFHSVTILAGMSEYSNGRYIVSGCSISVRCQFLKAVSTQMTPFWDAAPCSVVQN